MGADEKGRKRKVKQQPETVEAVGTHSLVGLSPSRFKIFLANETCRVPVTESIQVRAKTTFEAGISQLFFRDRLLVSRSLTIWLNAKLIPFQT